MGAMAPPLSDIFSVLRKNINKDKNWKGGLLNMKWVKSDEFFEKVGLLGASESEKGASWIESGLNPMSFSRKKN